MSRQWPVLALVLLFALQWAVPWSVIHRSQGTLAEGIEYRFRTAPVDPVDPFRGRFVVLDFEVARMPVDDASTYASDAPMYAPIRVGGDGFAELLPPQKKPPAAGDYLRVQVYVVGDSELSLALPFDRYYLDESLAPRAEQLYRDRNQRRPDATLQQSEAEAAQLPTYVTVRVRDGHAVLDQLVIDGRPLAEWFAEDR